VGSGVIEGRILNERLHDDVSAGEGGGVPQGTLSDLKAELPSLFHLQSGLALIL